MERMSRLLGAHGDRFVRRWFTTPEISECGRCRNQAQAYALRFAAKEAAWKAMALPLQGPLRWRSIGVLAPRGQPQIQLSGDVEQVARFVGATSIVVSWSLTGKFATAFALVLPAR